MHQLNNRLFVLLVIAITSGCHWFTEAQTAKEYFEKGVVLTIDGDFRLARKTLVKVLRTPSSDRELAELLIELIDGVSAHQSKQEVATHIFKGADHVKKKRLHAARDEYAKATTVDPRNAVMHFMFGAIFSSEFSYMADEVISAYQKAITLNPAFAKAHNFLGVAYARQSMWEEAVSAHKQAIAIDPNYADAYTTLGVRYGEKGMWDEAIAAHRKAIEITPNHPVRNLSTSLRHPGQSFTVQNALYPL